MNNNEIISIMQKKSKWIWCSEKAALNSYADFICEFSAEVVDNDAFIAISADSEYVLTVNSKSVSCGQFKMFPPEKSVDIIPIAKFLNSGSNKICITVQYFGECNMSYALGTAGLCFYIKNAETEIFSDENVVTSKGVCYKSGELYRTTGQIGFGYLYNATEDDGWKDASYKIGGRFKNAVCVKTDAQLTERPVKKLEFLWDKAQSSLISQGCFIRNSENGTPAQLIAGDYLKFVESSKLFSGSSFPLTLRQEQAEGSGVYAIFDLGHEVSGYFTFEIEAPKNTCIDIGYGEHLEDLRVRTAIDSRNFADRYISCGGRQTFTHFFRRIAGRYLELHFSGAEQLTIFNVAIIPAQYPLNRKKAPELSELRKKIYEISVDTLKNCMHEHYEDCPWREQALYSFDSRNQALCSYYAFDNPEFTRASLMLLGQSIGSDGFLKICAPTDGNFKIPSFTFAWVWEVKEYIDYCCDSSFIPFADEVCEKILDTAVSNMKNGLAEPPLGENYWHFYEWSDGIDGTIKNGTVTCMKVLTADENFSDGMYQMYVLCALRAGAKIAEYAQKSEVSAKYLQIADNLAKKINETFWHDEMQLYSSYKRGDTFEHYCEYMQALALYNGIAPDANGLCRKLMAGMKNKITLSASIYKYEGILKTDKNSLNWVLGDVDRLWNEMLKCGATTFWETLDGASAFDRAGSLCHGWSAIPIYIYEKYLLNH